MKKLITLLLALTLIITLASACAKEQEEPYVPTTHNNLAIEYTSISSEELMNRLDIGWNLGNTLDAPEGENAWGQPTTTPEMITKIKELGFNLIRIPVSWGLHTDEDFNIDPEWMDRVQEVVDYAISIDMYVIINSHHDNDFYYPTGKNYEEQGEKFFNAIWTQIAERFKDYDQHLIFEAMNEPRLTGTDWEWNIDISNKRCARAVEIINQYNQSFVDIVRASGGRNLDRFLMMSCYAGNGSYAVIDEFIIPTDTVEDRLMLSYHAYTPYNLAMGTSYDYVAFDADGKRQVDWVFKMVKEKFLDKGIPCIVTEMGCINKGNPQARYDWGEYYISKGKEYGVTCVWWDNQHNDFGEESYGLFDRTNLEIFDEAMPAYEGMMAGLEK